ncbi:hypothetical protein [Archangium lansingense]|uniref:Uncharacterized protein n=1 Tax=Archangium lansingense TaxID=2995310 RepID=A0ABT4A9Y5_9BACT|nr:hypothetical protein [Archangium lansinium]MCY1078478.1 hypothetical protein [Archangium lansinium]
MMKLPLLLLLLSAPALAAIRPAYVLRIEGADAFVDLGRADTTQPGERLRVYRIIEARHPATGKVLRDRFLLGEVTVLEAGETLSRISAPDELLARMEVGDEVESVNAPAPRERPATLGPAAQAQAPGATAPSTVGPSDAERAALRTAWNNALRLPPSERAKVWEGFLSNWPQSDLAGPIRTEISLLREAPVASSTTKVPASPVAPVLKVSAPTSALTDELITVSLSSLAGPTPRAAMVHWRERGSPTYRTVHMSADPHGLFRATLPQGSAVEPGIEYYVEAVEPAGATLSAAGNAARPQSITIRRPPRDERIELRDRSRVRVSNEYVDFNRFKGNDVYNLFEADFLYRVYTTVHAVRVGFGNYRGIGTPRDLLDTGVPGQEVGYTYGFGELELRLHPSLSVLLKGSAGVTEDGIKGGFDLGLRIGSETGTSLLIRGATIADIGQRGSLALAWDAVKGWPMSAEVVVTNEPIGEDLGVRLIYTVGRSVTPWLDIAGRVSYQLRDINHSGLGFGLGTTFHW